MSTLIAGKEVVIWQDAQKQWRCFEDRCPHRYFSQPLHGSESPTLAHVPYHERDLRAQRTTYTL